MELFRICGALVLERAEAIELYAMHGPQSATAVYSLIPSILTSASVAPLSPHEGLRRLEGTRFLFPPSSLSEFSSYPLPIPQFLL